VPANQSSAGFLEDASTDGEALAKILAVGGGEPLRQDFFAGVEAQQDDATAMGSCSLMTAEILSQASLSPGGAIFHQSGKMSQA